MLAIILCLFYQSTRIIRSSSNFIKIGDFGFCSNSTFSLEFTDIRSTKLVYCIFSQAELQGCHMDKFPVNRICREDSIFPELRFELFPESAYSINGTIGKSGIYSFVVVNCAEDDLSPSQTAITVNQVFHNPSSNLDFRWNGIEKSKTIIVIIFSSFLFLWLLDVLVVTESPRPAQLIISFAFLFHLLADLFRIYEIKSLERFDDDHGFTIARISMVIVHKMLLCSALIYIAKGWSTTTRTVSFKDVVLYIFGVAVFVAVSTAMEFVDFFDYELALTMVMILLSVMYVQEVVMSIRETRQYLCSKLISIIEQAEFTNSYVFKMRKVYTYLEIVVILGSFVHGSLMIVSIFVSVSFSVMETIKDGILMSFLVFLMVIFSINYGDPNNLLEKDSSLTDLESLRSSGDVLQNTVSSTNDAIDDLDEPTSTQNEIEV